MLVSKEDWDAIMKTNYLLRSPANAKRLAQSVEQWRAGNTSAGSGPRRVKLSWTDHAWDDCLYWQHQDRKTLKRINTLIADIKRNPDGPGIGKPELLRNNLSGLRSRRIDDEHRLVYAVEPDEITIVACRYHYE